MSPVLLILMGDLLFPKQKGRESGIGWGDRRGEEGVGEEEEEEILAGM